MGSRLTKASLLPLECYKICSSIVRRGCFCIRVYWYMDVGVFPELKLAFKFSWKSTGKKGVSEGFTADSCLRGTSLFSMTVEQTSVVWALRSLWLNWKCYLHIWRYWMPRLTIPPLRERTKKDFLKPALSIHLSRPSITCHEVMSEVAAARYADYSWWNRPKFSRSSWRAKKKILQRVCLSIGKKQQTTRMCFLLVGTRKILMDKFGAVSWLDILVIRTSRADYLTISFLLSSFSLSPLCYSPSPQLKCRVANRFKLG